MTTIHDIMQVGVGMPDRERFENFARDMLGFQVSRSPDGQLTYVRPDQYQHRIAARTAAEPVLRYVGFDVGGAGDLADMGNQAYQRRDSLAARHPRGVCRTTCG